MIDPQKFDELAQEMHRTAVRALELSKEHDEQRALALRARKEADDAAERWRAYCADEANLIELPNLFALGV